MTKKMEYLQSVNFDQQDKIKQIDQHKKETKTNLDSMQDKLKSLNTRMKTTNDMSKQKENKAIDKIEQLEQRIHQLQDQVKFEKEQRTKKVKPLPFQRLSYSKQNSSFEKKRGSRCSSKRSTKSTSGMKYHQTDRDRDSMYSNKILIRSHSVKPRKSEKKQHKITQSMNVMRHKNVSMKCYRQEIEEDPSLILKRSSSP